MITPPGSGAAPRDLRLGGIRISPRGLTVLPVILVADVLKEGPSPCAVAARRGALLAALNMGDQVMQRLCTRSDDKAGDQQVSPEWR